MQDFIVSKPEETVINLKDSDNKTIGTVEVVDVIDLFASARALAIKNGNDDEWHIYFQKEFKQLTGVTMSKTDAVLLYKHACVSIESLKKSGLKESEPTEPLDTPLPTPSET